MAFPLEKIDELAGQLAGQLEEIDLEKAMTYSLADAIREGSSVTGQCVGAWDDTRGNLCAMSAALLAIRARKMV